jgi:hypothetical protein
MTTSPRLPTAAALAVAAILSAAGSVAAADDEPTSGQRADADRLAAQARAYVGEPRHQQYRLQFWVPPHWHDSWNPCHLGEDVPKSKQGKGPECYSRLRSQTGR